MKNDWKLFSVRCLFKFEKDGITLFEERIVLIKARDFEEAFEFGEVEALKYSIAESCTYIDYIDVCVLEEQELSSGSELYSLMRESNLDPQDYIDRYFDTGNERQGEIERVFYDGSFLLEVVNGVSPMTLKLAQMVTLAYEGERLAYDVMARKLTKSNLSDVEAYQLGRALYEGAKLHLSKDESIAN